MLLRPPEVPSPFYLAGGPVKTATTARNRSERVIAVEHRTAKLEVLKANVGALFGAATWLLEDEGLNRALGLAAPSGEYPWQDHARGLATHVLYGMITDAALNVMKGRPVLH